MNGTRKVFPVKTLKFLPAFLRRPYLLQTAVYMLGNVLSQALAFFLLPVFTRYLSPQDYGIFNYTSSVQSFLLIISALSLNSFVLRHYFELKAEREQKNLFGTTFVFILFFNLCILCAAYLALPVLIERFRVKIPFRPYFEIALLSNFLESMTIIPLAYFRVKRKALRYFLLTGSRAFLTIGIGLLLVIRLQMGVLGRYYGVLAVNLLFGLVCLLIMARVSRLSLDFNLIRRGLKFSLPILPASFASIAIVSIDRIILERYVSVSELGIYSVGAIIGTALMTLVRGFYFAIEPEIYTAFKRPDFNAWIIRIKASFLKALLVLGCLVLVFCREIVSLMTARDFSGAYIIVPFFVIGSFFRGMEILVCTTLYALNKTAYHPLIVGAGLLLNVVACLIFIPALGILGAGVASALSFWFIYMLSAYITGKCSGICWQQWKNTLLVLLAAGVSLVVMNLNGSSPAMTLLLKSSATAAAGLGWWMFSVLKSRKGGSFV